MNPIGIDCLGADANRCRHPFPGRFDTASFVLPVLSLIMLLLEQSLPAQPTTYSFNVTITGAATETWYGANVIYNHFTVQSQGVNTNNCSSQDSHQQSGIAGMDGYATYSYGLSATRTICGTARVAISGVLADQLSNNDTPLTRTNGGSFPVGTGQSFNLSAIAEGGGSGALLDVFIPDHVENGTSTARHTNSVAGSAAVGVYAGETNLGGFYVPVQPQHGGTLSDLSYTISSDSSNVVLVFADTVASTTANPATTIIARVAVPNITPSSVIRTNNAIRFRWATIPGRTYQIQYRSAFGSDTWTNLGTAITASGTTLEYTEATIGQPQRFFRIRNP